LNPVILSTIITSAGVIIVGAIGYFTARVAQKSARQQTVIEERAKVVDGYNKLNEDLQTQNSKLNEKLDKLNSQIDELYKLREEDRKRIRSLEEEKDTHRAAIRVIIDYSNLLVELLRQHGIAVPQQPPELDRYMQ
jgi:peptidoglycan hydrolase CwlO-like protein